MMLVFWLMPCGWGAALGAEAEIERSESTARPSGLRFRSGPVCMCSGGLSEADIRQAERARSGESTDEDESEQENRSRGGENR
jgi:hypothetical protein